MIVRASDTQTKKKKKKKRVPPLLLLSHGVCSTTKGKKDRNTNNKMRVAKPNPPSGHCCGDLVPARAEATCPKKQIRGSIAALWVVVPATPLSPTLPAAAPKRLVICATTSCRTDRSRTTTDEIKNNRPSLFLKALCFCFAIFASKRHRPRAGCCEYQSKRF